MSSLPCAFFSGATCLLRIWQFSQASKLPTWVPQHAFVCILWVSGSRSPQIARMQFFGSYDLKICLPDERKYMIFIHHEVSGDWWMQLSSTRVWSYHCDLSFERIDESLILNGFCSEVMRSFAVSEIKHRDFTPWSYLEKGQAESPWML